MISKEETKRDNRKDVPFSMKNCTKTLGTTCAIFFMRVGEGPAFPSVENKN